MKKYILFAVALILAAGCAKEKDEAAELAAKPRQDLEVSYSVDGATVGSLTFGPKATRQTVMVNVNNDNLRWNLQSNQPWCKVVPEVHVGSGPVTLEIDVNETFSDRNQATLVFSAGEFGGFNLTVDQEAATFAIDKPYVLVPRTNDPIEIKVSTQDGTIWDYEGDPWLEVSEKSSAVNAAGDKVTTLQIIPSENDSSSRLGKVKISAGDESEFIYVYQFGLNLSYDIDGNIFFPKEYAAAVTFVAPKYVIREVVLPKFAKYTVSDNGDGTETYEVSIEENLSDCELIRNVPISLKLNNAAATEVQFPVMVQDFLPAGGLVSAIGLKTFAETINNGGDTSSWETDGVVKVLQDIDMEGVEDWKGIGVEDMPFGGEFDGCGHAIINLKNAGSEIFGYCNGAVIRNLTINKTCSFFTNSAGGFGGLVHKAIGTTIEHCSFLGALNYAGKADGDSVGGIVAVADGDTSVESCKMGGTVTVSSSTVPADNYSLKVGGIVGSGDGTFINCEMSGTITITSGHAVANVGGITSVLEGGAVITGNAFLGTIELNSGCKSANIGGLYGSVPAGSATLDFASDKSSPAGTIKILNYASDTGGRIFAGGVTGLIGKDVALTVKGLTSGTNFYVDYSTGKDLEYICTGGILGGCEPDDLSGELNFESVTNEGEFLAFYSSTAAKIKRNCVGGIAGLVNGKATFTKCVNKGVMKNAEGSAANNGRSNTYTMIMGGIAGHCYGADMTFDSCENQVDLNNNFYSNDWGTTANGNYLSPTATGGIVGAFNYKPNPQNKKVTIKDCTCKADLCALRGYLGGIIGYAFGAEISNCSWNGNSAHKKSDKSDNQSGHKGGIAGGLGKATVKDCTVKANISSVQAGSATSTEPGGIVGRAMALAENDGITITNCAYYGKLAVSTTSKTDPVVGYPGGIVGLGVDDTSVSKCRFGGSIEGVDISATSVNEKAIGNGVGTVAEISYWNGN